MKKKFQIPHFVRKKIISSHLSLKNSIFAMLSLLEMLPQVQKSRFRINTRCFAGLLIKSTGCGRPLKAER